MAAQRPEIHRIDIGQMDGAVADAKAIGHRSSLSGPRDIPAVPFRLRMDEHEVSVAGCESRTDVREHWVGHRAH